MTSFCNTYLKDHNRDHSCKKLDAIFGDSVEFSWPASSRNHSTHKKKRKGKKGRKVWGHSTTTWTKFHQILTTQPLEWTIVNILDKIYPLFMYTKRGLFTDHLSTSSCPRNYWMPLLAKCTTPSARCGMMRQIGLKSETFLLFQY